MWWKILNSGIITTIIGIIFGSWATIKIVEEKKKKDKRKLLLNILNYELNAYTESEPLGEQTSFRFPHRDKLIWNILTSDILDRKKDKELITNLYELIGWIENYNCANNHANQAILLKNDEMISLLGKGRDSLYNSSYKQKEVLVKLLRSRYKIK